MFGIEMSTKFQDTYCAGASNGASQPLLGAAVGIFFPRSPARQSPPLPIPAPAECRPVRLAHLDGSDGLRLARRLALYAAVCAPDAPALAASCATFTERSP